jgi:hypothetical protein
VKVPLCTAKLRPVRIGRLMRLDDEKIQRLVSEATTSNDDSETLEKENSKQ